MTAKQRDKDLEALVEQKILEFFGDPDTGLKLKRGFLAGLRKRMGKEQKFTSHAGVLKKYGLH